MATPTPGIGANYSSYNDVMPAGGVYPYFPLSPYHTILPSAPATVPPATAALWASYNTTSKTTTPGNPGYFDNITVSESATNGNDRSDPTYYTAGEPQVPTVYVQCALYVPNTASGKYLCWNGYYPSELWNDWTFPSSDPNCVVTPSEGFAATQNYGCPVPIGEHIPLGAKTASDSDHHFNVIHTTESIGSITGYEGDHWGAHVVNNGSGTAGTSATPPPNTIDATPPPSAPFSDANDYVMGAMGACDLSQDGADCSNSYATQIAGSLGLVNPADWAAALAAQANGSNPNSTLPYAISIATKCNSWVAEYPATNSDAQCAAYSASYVNGKSELGYPEGARGFLTGVTDAMINANPNIPAYMKPFWRTMDSQHYGVIVRDAGSYVSPGAYLQYQGGEAWASMGYASADPWRIIGAAAVAAGEPGITQAKVNSGEFVVPIPAYYNLTNFSWCSNLNPGPRRGTSAGQSNVNLGDGNCD